MDYIVIAAICFIVIIGLLFKIKGSFHSKNQRSKSSRSDNHEAITPRRKFNRVRVTLEESWKFLTDISNAVINKFSKRDQAIVLELGRVLHKAGAAYNHVIEYGVRSMYQFTPNESQSESKADEKGKKAKAQR